MMRCSAGRWCVFVLLCSPVLIGQTPSAKPAASPEPAATIKSSTRLVLLDALVTDNTGHPVHGLKAQDFTVLEDGKPQQIRGFEERGPQIQPTGTPVTLNLPANTYTNYVPEQEPGAVNILLFDSLNTDRQSLVKARKELLLYLSKLPAGSRVALYTLDSELHLVHGFTEDSARTDRSCAATLVGAAHRCSATRAASPKIWQ